jgi:hypothetical protein
MKTETIPFEMTDTFGGEANYSWVRRGEVSLREGASDLALVRAVKAELGLTGVRCQREEYGEQIVLRPVGACVVVFIG